MGKESHHIVLDWRVSELVPLGEDDLVELTFDELPLFLQFNNFLAVVVHVVRQGLDLLVFGLQILHQAFLLLRKLLHANHIKVAKI